jgi:hypothetical protein
MRYLIVLLLFAGSLNAQTRAIRADEYEKAKTFTVKDLDKDTYVKFNNAYVLDRYEMRKPYFITGDDNLKKRIDLYRLVAKDSMLEIGTVIFYTNEQGKLYTAVMPIFNSGGDVWNKYFEDIHAIDKVEKNFVLKLSYVLSKEFSFQLYKAMSGKDVKAESGTYGTDICFPGDQMVTLASGGFKSLKEVVSGDKIVGADGVVTVRELVVHTPRNYAITQLLVVRAEETGVDVHISGKVLRATPNHPIQTGAGRKKIGEIDLGDEVFCGDARYVVVDKKESAEGVQPVYNLVTDKGDSFMMNEVRVLQK